MDTIRVLRILEYVGPRDKVEDTLKRCSVPVNGSRGYGENGVTIHSAIVGDFPEILHSNHPIKLKQDYLDKETGFYKNRECSVCHDFPVDQKLHRKGCKYDPAQE